MRYIDLSLPLVPHWRCPISTRSVKSIAAGNAYNICEFTLYTHWYTHIDAPLHVSESGKSLDDFPISRTLGEALVLDISFIRANEEVSRAMLEDAVAKAGTVPKIILLKSLWDTKADWHSHAYWDDAPYMSEAAADFLAALEPHTVGFDFPQDYEIRNIPTKGEHNCVLTTHERILKKDILMIEYLCNMAELQRSRIELLALPLALPHTDGAQIRCIAVEDDAHGLC